MPFGNISGSQGLGGTLVDKIPQIEASFKYSEGLFSGRSI